MSLIALDPGKGVVYGAVFGALVPGGAELYCKSLRKFQYPVEPHLRDFYRTAVTEKPSLMNVPNVADMGEVRWHGALVASAISSHVVSFEPSQWKGGLKKPIHHYRVWQSMTAAEWALFPSDTLEVINKACARYAQTSRITGYSFEWTNHLDALALGMFYLGRIKRGGEKGGTNV